MWKRLSLQIVLAEEDRYCKRFLWADNFPPNNLKTYRSKIVTFGEKSSPFLLAATLKRHIKNYEISYPLAYKVLNEYLYVDDLITGTNAVNETLELSKHTKLILNYANMNLRKWKTNSIELSQEWEETDESNEELNENQIVIFCDASERAHGAIAYIRYKTNSDFHANFVSSKARVAPLKKLSLPRLELLATLIGGRLLETLRKNDRIKTPLTAEEIEEAEEIWIKVQGENFGIEIHCLKNKNLPKDSKIRELNPFLNERESRNLSETTVDCNKPSGSERILRIKWQYIIERGAWWGGFYERIVRSVKTILRKVTGKSSLTSEELETVLCEIEAVLNSRPITYIDSDSTGNFPLTPSHFLLERRLTSFPVMKHSTVDCVVDKKVLLKQFSYSERLLNNFYRQWRKEYLLNLKSVHFVNPMKETKFKINDIVLIHDRFEAYGNWVK
ncbi:uncharacterized protein TNCV_2417311 [Trichonephila clavipes]|nr:uncharacterized protein TNCV_2417311 [Trichonephila clavipes]